MERAESLDKPSRILITEWMARGEGGVCFFCTCTGLEARMRSVMARLTDFECTEADNTDRMGWTDVPDRFRKALEQYRNACETWGRL